MKVDGAVKSLLQGVSQQPRETRFPGQCTEQLNMSSNPVTGLARRPPVEFVGELLDVSDLDTPVEPTFLQVNYGTDTYTAVLTPELVRLYDSDGVFVQDLSIDPTTDEAVYDYIAAGDLCSICAGDTAFIASRNVLTAMEIGTHTYNTGSSLVAVIGGQYGRTFSVTVKWSTHTITGSYVTPNGSTSADILKIASTYIATELKAALDAISTDSFNTLFTVTRVEDVLWIHPVSPTSFSVSVADGEGGTMIKASNNSVDSLSSLPRFAPNGYLCSVIGLGSSDKDDYYVQYVLDDDTLTGDNFGAQGTWRECVAPGVPYQLDAGTMPIGLVRDPDTLEFSIDVLTWEDRRCGDDETNPLPSFIGYSIADLGVFQGRLVLVSASSVIMSRTNKYRDFFRQTATQSTDSDVIDMSSTADGVGQMLFCIPHNRDLIVWANGAQFIILGRAALTPENCSLILTTTFDSNLDIKPIAAGRNVFFGYEYGTSIGIREFYTMDSIDANDSRPVTQHVQTYIPGTLGALIGSSDYDTLWVIPQDSEYMYPYEYIWGDTQKVQSSWSSWKMPFHPETGWITGSDLFLVAKTGNVYNLYRMDLDVHDDDDIGYKVQLDNRRVADCVEGSIAIPEYSEDMIFIRGSGFTVPGMRLLPIDTITGGSSTEVVFDTTEDGEIIYGVPYSSEYTPTMPFVKDADGVAIGTGKFIIKEFIFSTTKTGEVKYKITSLYRDTTYGMISGRTVGDPRTEVGVQALSDSQLHIPFRDNASQAELTIYTDSFTPMTLTNMEYRGEYIHKGTRLQQGK